MSTQRKQQLIDLARQTITTKADEFYLAPNIPIEALKKHEKWLSKANPPFSSDEIVCAVLEKGVLMMKDRYSIIFTENGMYFQKPKLFFDPVVTLIPYQKAKVKLLINSNSGLGVLMSACSDRLKDISINKTRLKISQSDIIPTELALFIKKAAETAQF